MSARDDLLKRFSRTFGKVSAEEAFERTRAIVGPSHMPGTGEGKLAQEALDALSRAEDPEPRQLAALELIIKLMRPAPLSRGGLLDSLPEELIDAFPGWENFRKSARTLIDGVGRIEASGQGVGTGFLIDTQLLLTNRHVLDLISRGTLKLEPGQACVTFHTEYDNYELETPVKITGVAAVAESLDMAMLKIEKPLGGTPLPIDDTPVDVGHGVAAIGYPYDDPQRNPSFIRGVYGGIFGVRRGAPGEILKLGDSMLAHDCSTLGGNSGSPVFSIERCTVVGLHSEGFFMYRNQAVNGAAVKAFAAANA